jgi:hypothetical protein
VDEVLQLGIDRGGVGDGLRDLLPHQNHP